MLTKSRLAIRLSQLKVFDSPSLQDEQYPTDSEIAADVLWNAYMHGDIEGKTIADLGCGTGILAIGAALLGAEKVYAVEKDKAAIDIAKENAQDLNIIFINKTIAQFDEKVDVVIQNPPFGTKEKHADKPFLEKAMQLAPIIYSFHKAATADFVEKTAAKSGFEITAVLSYQFPIKAVHKFHRRKLHRIEVDVFRLSA